MPPGSRSTTSLSRHAALLLCTLLLAACAHPAPPPPPRAIAPPPLLPLAPVPAAPSVVASPPLAAPLPLPPEPEPELDVGPTLPAKPYLALGAAARFPRRALLARSGPMSLTLGGRPFGERVPVPVSWSMEGIVVEEHPHSLRLVLDDGEIRIVLFAPRAALHVVSTRAAWLAPALDRAPDPAAGVRIAPGVVLEEIAHQPPLHHVRGEVSLIGFEGWLPDDAVGVTFVPGRFPAGGHGGLVAESTVVTSAAGEIIARLPPPYGARAPLFSFEVTPRTGSPAGFQAIQLRLDDIEVTGLVPSASYQKAPPRTGTPGNIGPISRGLGFIPHTEHALLRKGAELLDDAGEPIGLAMAESHILLDTSSIGDKGLRWAHLNMIPFGFCLVRVRGTDVRPLRR